MIFFHFIFQFVTSQIYWNCFNLRFFLDFTQIIKLCVGKRWWFINIWYRYLGCQACIYFWMMRSRPCEARPETDRVINLSLSLLHPALETLVPVRLCFPVRMLSRFTGGIYRRAGPRNNCCFLVFGLYVFGSLGHSFMSFLMLKIYQKSGNRWKQNTWWKQCFCNPSHTKTQFLQSQALHNGVKIGLKCLQNMMLFCIQF